MSGWLPVSLADFTFVAKLGCRYNVTILQVMPHNLQVGAEVFSQNNFVDSIGLYVLVILLFVIVIRLVGGGASYGNVLVDNKPICDGGWDQIDAEVVCSMLNMSAVAATTYS